MNNRRYHAKNFKCFIGDVEIDDFAYTKFEVKQTLWQKMKEKFKKPIKEKSIMGSIEIEMNNVIIKHLEKMVQDLEKEKRKLERDNAFLRYLYYDWPGIY